MISPIPAIRPKALKSVLQLRARPVITALALTLAVATTHAADNLTVKTDHGKIMGSKAADESTRVFLGVPYAAPPVGPLRWKPPQAAAKWRGTRSATAFGNRCMQAQLFADMVFRDPSGSEDCLTLNIWIPAKNKHAKLPVMVWIYGGGFVTGGTSEPRQDGVNLSHNGVIVVSMNYRLGIFGFFVQHELAAENDHHAAGNYGLMDQSAAIAWVRKNIAGFGGDPENLTVFGESAGSISVSAQMASPRSRDLFQKAIGESGGAFSRTALAFPKLEVAEKADEAFAAKAFNTTSLAALRALPAEELLLIANEKDQNPPRFAPDIDGDFLPESVADIYAAGKQLKIPLLAGWNRDEGTAGIAMAAEKPTVASLRAMAEKQFGARAEDFLRAFAAGNDEQAIRVAEDFAGDTFIAYSTWAWLEAQAKTGEKPVFRYRFDRPSPGDPNHPPEAGAFHSDDIEYVFGNLDVRKGAAWKPEDYTLSKQMQMYWTSFAKTGDPGSVALPDLPAWPRYDASGQWQVLHLDAPITVEPDAHRDRYVFLQSVWSPPSELSR